jgi:hypothetical protein
MTESPFEKKLRLDEVRTVQTASPLKIKSERSLKGIPCL